MDQVKKTLSELEKLGIVMKPFSDYGTEKQTLQFFSTGSLSLNAAIGLGGYPRGRFIEMYGREGCGKSTMCLITIADVQKQGGVAAYIDAENGFDPEYSKKLGVDTSKLLYAVPDNGEQAFETLRKLIESNAIDFIVVDSLAALVPQKEIENPMDKETMGLQARLVSSSLRKINGILSKSKTVVVFINQLREKIGVMYGNPETTPGGLALKFYSSLRMQVYREKDSTIKDGDRAVGHSIKVKVVKNKVGIPMREAIFAYRYDGGIDTGSELLGIGLEKGIIKLEGRTYSFDSNSWVGREACQEAIQNDKLLQEKLLVEMTKAYNNFSPVLAATEVEEVQEEEPKNGKKKVKKD